MDLGLAGKTAAVTGGSKGIGLAVLGGLASAGAHVVTGAQRSSADLDELTRTGDVEVPPGRSQIRARMLSGPR